MNVAKLALAAFLLAGSATAASAVAVVNGSFEDSPAFGAGFVTYGTGSTNLTGWTISNGSIDHIGSYWNASNGNRSIDLNGNSAGTISQALNTVAGTRYRVSFDIASNPDNQALKSMLVGFGDATPVSVQYTGAISQPLGWQSVVLEFTASSNASVLSFTGGDTGAYGIALDNVSVSAVPEPAMWAMMVAGFGFVGASLRRRKSGIGQVNA
ncbi:choice-of-anchor C family PEP-CTERM protein [Sandaracinobacteroides hominis]|uniref:choice-of-anchor C family PEP-CTERM protein n=1 Tax=Sandaracinobacteroides hominis TaxID=2780086 RepID=UPI001F304449|nr:choice-of-anchor C family protein [Sandaracinobacteroides hominis]